MDVAVGVGGEEEAVFYEEKVVGMRTVGYEEFG